MHLKSLLVLTLLWAGLSAVRSTESAEPAKVKPATPARELKFDKLPGKELRGGGKLVDGVDGQALALEGEAVVVVPDSKDLTCNAEGFAVTVWVNPATLDRGQQMIVAKNRYNRQERQWGLMIDEDGHFRLYVRQGDWRDISATSVPQPGHWTQLGVVVRPDSAELFVNGRSEASMPLRQPIPVTEAPLTVGGSTWGGNTQQTLLGAIDEVRVYAAPVSAEQIAAGYSPQTATLPVIASVPAKDCQLWDTREVLPRKEELPTLKNISFSVIKAFEPEKDGGYRFLHGVGLCWHKGKLYASFGHNKGSENTAGEEARGRVSTDGGKTWGETFTIGRSDEPTGAISHGVFLSYKGELWAFHGSFHKHLQSVRTLIFRLNETTDQWERMGSISQLAFWPAQEPIKMEDGNWIMSGTNLPDVFKGGSVPAAVAISHGDDLTQWDVIVLKTDQKRGIWGESSVIVKGPKIINICRFGGRALALKAVSEDYGRTWTSQCPSNLPMATSKPYTGTLSTGQNYLVCSNTANSGARRSPLTIAVSRPGEEVFSRVFLIRHAEMPDSQLDSAPNGALSYPYAVEHEGRLYVGYSNNGGRRGTNINSAELAIIPIEDLRVD